jgi:malonyl-CoA O-methyltransferase
MNQGIAVTSKNTLPYPEVTGYYIPTLLKWGDKDKAISFARWLVSIQNADGSWNDPSGENPYTFDTGQILKGLIDLVDFFPEFQDSILNGCNWILSQQKNDGRITTPDTKYWSLPDGKFVPEAIHLYVLQPIRIVGQKWGLSSYIEAVDKAVDYYLSRTELLKLDTLSHFHAYIIEALIDLGYVEQVRQAMGEIAILQKRNGAIPAYKGVSWVCSTALFQYAVIWYKLGDVLRANKSFNYACTLQNKSGGFFGSYGQKPTYFPKEEISWAIKYFLDALWWKIKTSFDVDARVFPDKIDETDGRLQLIIDIAKQGDNKRVIDMGCGKGRFLNQFKRFYSEANVYGMDISEKMLTYLAPDIKPVVGTLLSIPYQDEFFDLAFCVEALEHAVDIPRAIKEMGRVIRKDGILIIIDKNIRRLGKLQISEWEQWFEQEQITWLLQNEGFKVTEHHNIPYDANNGRDNLFIGWVAYKLNKT